MGTSWRSSSSGFQQGKRRVRNVADKPKMDIGLLFGSPKGGSASGPDEDFKDMASTVLDDKAPMRDRIEALHELITMVCDEHAKGDEPEDEPSTDQDEPEDDSDKGY